MTPPFRFGVSQFTIWPWSFEQDVDNYARLGVETIEVCESKLDDECRFADQLTLIEQRGLRISSFQPAIRPLFLSQLMPEPEDLGERVALFRRAIECASRFAQEGVPFVCNTGPPPNGDFQKVFDVAA